MRGKLYCPADPDLRARKLRAHNLCTRYNAAFEDDAAQRSEILRALFASLGADSFLQGPIYIHYGCHTTIGERFFGNFNLTVQDDAPSSSGTTAASAPARRSSRRCTRCSPTSAGCSNCRTAAKSASATPSR